MIDNIIEELKSKNYVMVGLSSALSVKNRIASDFNSKEVDNIVCTIHDNSLLIANIGKKLPEEILRIFSKSA